jgi:hypothetical protein
MAVTTKSAVSRSPRADAVRNRRRVLDAAREAFAERGMDAQVEDGQVGAAPVELGEQVGIAIERDDLVSPPREVERHATGAGADVEDRPAGQRGELAPQRQIGRVRAAFEIVPEHAKRV